MFERQLSEKQAIFKCKRWKVIRDWMIAVDISFAHLPEEVEY